VRRARANDHWRRLVEEKDRRQISLRSFQFDGVTGLGTSAVPLHEGLTVICGANGVGKSTLLTISRLTLDPRSATARTRCRHENCSAKMEVSLSKFPGQVLEFKIENGTPTVPEEADIPVFRIDPGEEWFQIKTLVRKTANWNELLDQIDSRALDRKELARLSFLTGKNYSACELYEITEFDALDEFPYVTVTLDGHDYSFEEMGAGEGALFLIWWHLNRIPARSIILLEEPETHVAAHSQRALMDCVAESCERNVCCIMTTHSSEIISCVPKECIRLLIRQGAGVEVQACPMDSVLNSVLGVGIEKRLVAIVEDRCAREVTVELLRLLRPEIANRVLVTDVGDDSAVVHNGRFFPEMDTLRAVCILDGSERGRFKRPGNLKHPVIFLPTIYAPDEMLREYCRNEPDRIAERLDANRDLVVGTLASINGADHHDWLESLEQGLGTSYVRTVGALLAVALEDAGFREASLQFIMEITELVDPTLVAEEPDADEDEGVVEGDVGKAAEVGNNA